MFKRLTSAIFATLLVFAPISANAALAIVQTKTATGTSNSPAVTLTTTPTVGDLMIATLGWASATASAGIPAGWTAITKQQGTASCYAVGSWVLLYASGGSTFTFTTLLNASVPWELSITEVSGQNQTTPINNANAGNTCGSSALLHPSATSTVTGEIVFALANDDGTGTAITAPAGYAPQQAVTSLSTGHYGLYTLSFASGTGTGVQTPSWGTVTDGRAQTFIVAPATPKPTGSLPMMGCCK